jgi:hypothetical protein
MSNGRLDALTVRESNGKSCFTKIGAAFPSRNGNGYSILLDAMPAPTDGQFKILLMEPKPRESAMTEIQRGGQEIERQLDDEIPGWD